MLNMTLYKREMKGSLKLLLIFGAVLTLYISIIIRMYDPEMMATLDSFYEVMPEVMASVGMSAGATSLIGFMISYLYGFILLIFPMLFSILRGNGLVAKYVDRGSMVTLVAAPGKAQNNRHDADVRTDQRYLSAGYLCNRSGTADCSVRLSGGTGGIGAFKAECRAPLSAAVYRKHLFSCVLYFF